MGTLGHVVLALIGPLHMLDGLLSLGTFGFAVGCAELTVGRELRGTLKPRSDLRRIPASAS